MTDIEEQEIIDENVSDHIEGFVDNEEDEDYEDDVHDEVVQLPMEEDDEARVEFSYPRGKKALEDEEQE